MKLKSIIWGLITGDSSHTAVATTADSSHIGAAAGSGDTSHTAADGYYDCDADTSHTAADGHGDSYPYRPCDADGDSYPYPCPSSSGDSDDADIVGALTSFKFLKQNFKYNIKCSIENFQ